MWRCGSCGVSEQHGWACPHVSEKMGGVPASISAQDIVRKLLTTFGAVSASKKSDTVVPRAPAQQSRPRKPPDERRKAVSALDLRFVRVRNAAWTLSLFPHFRARYLGHRKSVAAGLYLTALHRAPWAGDSACGQARQRSG